MEQYNYEYEAMVRGMTDTERLEEAHLAFKHMRDSWRNYEVAMARYAIICTVRAEAEPFDEDAQVIDLTQWVPNQRANDEKTVS